MPAASTILPDEKNLFALMAAGDESAFRQIFDHYATRVYPFLLSKTKSEDLARELTQEIFIKLWTVREQLASVEHHSAYIFTMAARLVYMYFRKAARDQQLAQEWYSRIEQLRNTTEEWMDAREHEQLVEKAVEQLPPQRRRIYELSRIKGMNHAEIAKELNLSPSTVNNQLSEALKSIRNYINRSPEMAIAILVYLLQGK
jgi:RNA polymerase sigma-70 factor (ECF subfamily)